jgi:4-hydroxybenzoyl-CoA thioesterase
MAAFQREVQVRFGACDPATFVYYPRYFEMINSFVEDWFEDGLEASFPGLMYHKGILAPTVHFTIDFPRPSRFGDRLTFTLEVTKIGRSSCELLVQASSQGEVRVAARQVLVFMDATKRSSVAIPLDIAKRMKHFLVSESASISDADATALAIASKGGGGKRKRAQASR